MIKTHNHHTFFRILKATSLCLFFAQFTGCDSEQIKTENENNTIVSRKRENADFNGILDFKINSFTVDDLSRSIYTYEEKKFNKNDKYPDWWLLYTRKFYIDKIDFKKIKLSSVELQFYHNILISMTCISNDELLTALRVKFPNYYDNKEGVSEYRFEDQCWTWYNSYIEGVFCSYGPRFSISDTIMVQEVRNKEHQMKEEYIAGEYKEL